MSELLAVVALRDVNSIRDTTSAKVNKDLVLLGLDDVINFDIYLDGDHTESATTKIFFNKENVECLVFVYEIL